MSTFVNHNGLTDDGKKVVHALETMIEAADRNPNALNNLPGYARHYAANVQLAGTMTQEQWLREFPNAATIVLESVRETEAKAQKEADAKKSQTALEKRLEKLEKELAKTRKQLREATATKEAPVEEASDDADEADEAEETEEDNEADDSDGDDA